jgi:hypothetical protein
LARGFPAPASGYPAANLETLLPINPQKFLVIEPEALARQQNAQPPIAKPATLRRQRPQALPQTRILGPSRTIPNRSATDPKQSTRPPLAQPMNLTGVRNSHPPRGGRYHFFDAKSFKTALSSMAFAKSFFNRAFSSSSPFSRLASETSRPPYFDFHL